MNIFELIERRITERYLKRKKEFFLKNYPQLVCFSWDHISDVINTRGRYELEECQNLKELVFPKLSHKRVCLDIGANIGNHSVFFAELFERVISFEPNPRTFKLLSLNTERIKNIEINNIGASDSKRQIDVMHNAVNAGGTRIENDIARLEVTEETLVNFQVDSLDNYIDKNIWPQVDFLKIDVEGHELSALRGLKEIIALALPVIAFECQPEEFTNGSTPVIDLLKQYGYNNFYEFRDKTTRNAMPKAASKIVNGIKILFSGKHSEFSLYKLESFEAKLYSMIIASRKTLA